MAESPAPCTAGASLQVIFMWKRIIGNSIYAFGTTLAGLYVAGMPDVLAVALVPALITFVVTLGAELKQEIEPYDEKKKGKKKGTSILPL